MKRGARSATPALPERVRKDGLAAWDPCPCKPFDQAAEIGDTRLPESIHQLHKDLANTMRTRRLFLNRLDPAHEPVDAVVVIDVLRSFTTAAYAFAAGASTIYPVETIAGAFRLLRRVPDAATTGAVGAVTRYPVSISATRHRPCRTPTLSVDR
jgi:hypothetical protein